MYQPLPLEGYEFAGQYYPWPGLDHLQSHRSAGRIAIVGLSQAGKKTLVNILWGWRALNGMANMLDAAQHANDLDQLRGYEGRAAAFYFEGLRALIPPEWGFEQRAYYPPPDPANALLSFTYTLLRKDVEAKIQLVGLDPYLGFFHALGYNRPALALDMMEEFRPSVADLVVLALINQNHITPDDFEWTNNPDLPVRMSQPAIQTVLAAYEDRLADEVYHPLTNGQTDYRRVIELQVRTMARIIRGEESDYPPVSFR